MQLEIEDSNQVSGRMSVANEKKLATFLFRLFLFAGGCVAISFGFVFLDKNYKCWNISSEITEQESFIYDYSFYHTYTYNQMDCAVCSFQCTQSSYTTGVNTSITTDVQVCAILCKQVERIQELTTEKDQKCDKSYETDGVLLLVFGLIIALSVVFCSRFF